MTRWIAKTTRIAARPPTAYAATGEASGSARETASSVPSVASTTTTETSSVVATPRARAKLVRGGRVIWAGAP